MSAPLILVVEDDHDIREGLVELLATFGYLTVAARHGEEALQLLQKADVLPALIVLDLMMPVMDGYTFRAEQMARPEWANIPVLVLSADLNAHGRLPDVAAILRKPAEVLEFMATLSKLAPAP